jgi:hypothetical protein
MATFAVLSFAAFAADRNVGTWKLDPAKSKNMGEMTGRVMKISKVGENKFHYEFETTTKDGKTTRNTDERVCDGKGHHSVADKSIMYTCAEGHTVFKRDDKPYLEYIGTYSADGKTFTNVTKTWTKDGQAMPDQIRVYDRQ